MMPAWLARTFLRLFNMRVVDHNEGNWPAKCVVPVGPHTSNWDFPYGLWARAAIKQRIGFVGKESLFVWPVGPILKAMGGVPVVRKKRTNFVQAVAHVFNTREEFKLCIAMEGTRGKVQRFRTGFYYIAREANVPLILVRFNFGERIIEFSKPFYLTDDIRADFDFIYRHYDGIKGLKPKNSFEYDPEVALKGIG
ncbi:MAG: 1-acyl-sn-glycerol-3-phosphate acyltransferase [Bacteroidota bacterium]